MINTCLKTCCFEDLKLHGHSYIFFSLMYIEVDEFKGQLHNLGDHLTTSHDNDDQHHHKIKILNIYFSFKLYPISNLTPHLTQILVNCTHAYELSVL